jgi:thymidylate synthase (FAD)
MVTEWYWTGSLAAFARVCKLRTSEDSQDETREVVKLISSEMSVAFPISWKHLVK